jgi:tellurite methyltransferase
MPEVSVDWSEFHRAALLRPPRELLRRTLGCFELEKAQPGVAVDLGCGSGPDSAELLKRGWRVHAVDTSDSGLKLLRSSLGAMRVEC